MPDGDNNTLLAQILVGVVIAVLAGGTAPWWWTAIGGESADELAAGDDRAQSPSDPAHAIEAYEAIQALYVEARKLPPDVDCPTVRLLIEKIRVHGDDANAVPPSFEYTVKYPADVTDPTIGDIAADRISRIERQRAGCIRTSR